MGATILALDQGTTSSRAILFGRDGAVIAAAQAELPQHYPAPGWVEHEPDEIWHTQLATARRVLREAGITATEVHAIGIANQRETAVLWDRETGRAVHPAIVWQDRRTAEACTALREAGATEWIDAITGLEVDSYFSATKLVWLLDHVAGARDAAASGRLAFGTVDSFLLWRLSGGRIHATDASNASRTMLFDIHRRTWSEPLLAQFGVPPSVLPTVVSSSGMAVHIDKDLLGASIPVAGIAGDQQAALFGQACFRPGMAKCTYGTGAFLLLNTGSRPARSANRLLTTIAASAGDYALEGSVFIAGAAVQWLRDELGFIEHASHIDGLAGSVPDAGGVTVVPAFVGLGAPHWDASARGAILGLTRGSSRAHIARATLESIAFQCRDVVDAMSRDAGHPLKELRVDGGASASNLLMQMQADVLGIRIVRSKVTETTALGAAYLAGLATGFWSSTDEIAAQWAIDRVFEPTWPADRREAAYAGWQAAVSRVR